MQNHPIAVPSIAPVITDRLHELYLRAYSHCARKPQHVADVKAQKRPATFVKHLFDYRKMLVRGADQAVILQSIDELRAEVVAWGGSDAVGCPTTEAIAETRIQGHADTLVLVALKTDDEHDIARAYDAQQADNHHGNRLAKALGRRLAEKRGMAGMARRFFGLTPRAG